MQMKRIGFSFVSEMRRSRTSGGDVCSCSCYCSCSSCCWLNLYIRCYCSFSLSIYRSLSLSLLIISVLAISYIMHRGCLTILVTWSTTWNDRKTSRFFLFFQFGFFFVFDLIFFRYLVGSRAVTANCCYSSYFSYLIYSGQQWRTVVISCQHDEYTKWAHTIHAALSLNSANSLDEFSLSFPPPSTSIFSSSNGAIDPIQKLKSAARYCLHRARAAGLRPCYDYHDYFKMAVGHLDWLIDTPASNWIIAARYRQLLLIHCRLDVGKSMGILTQEMPIAC